eukprot:4213589-Heterocapsa_arctica.AAC.1
MEVHLALEGRCGRWPGGEGERPRAARAGGVRAAVWSRHGAISGGWLMQRWRCGQIRAGRYQRGG